MSLKEVGTSGALGKTTKTAISSRSVQGRAVRAEVTAPSTFVLTQVSPGVWQAPANASVVVDVRSVNANASTMLSTAYPDDTTVVKGEDGTATFTIASDGSNHSLTVDIVPAVPPDDWFIVEVGTGQTTQTLLGLVAGEALGSVLIRPKA